MQDLVGKFGECGFVRPLAYQCLFGIGVAPRLVGDATECNAGSADFTRFDLQRGGDRDQSAGRAL